jgi:putative flippase GtrA
MTAKAELLRYALVGVFNTLLGYGIFLLALRYFGLSPAVANAVSYAVALLAAFVLNRLYVFQHAPFSWRSVLRFITAFALAFGINQWVLWALLRWTVRAEFAQIAAMVTYTLVFYVLNKFFVFSRPQSTEVG